jgi:hypothetical protein
MVPQAQLHDIAGRIVSCELLPLIAAPHCV